MVDVRRVKLPGVGVLHTFADSDKVSDSSKVSLRLDEDEAHTLAELLGGTKESSR